VSIPVTVYAATARAADRLPLHQVHTRCGGGRIRQRRYCEREEIDVPWDEVARRYQAADGRVVILTEADLADLPLPTARAIEVLAFVPDDAVDQLLADRPYWLGVDRTAGAVAARPYALLREAMRQARQVAVARVTLRTRESLALLHVRGHVLGLQTLLWPDELRPPDDITIPETPPPGPRNCRWRGP
jgi:DNA end-binding protein Ku